jgi:hypothetical protein
MPEERREETGDAPDGAAEPSTVPVANPPMRARQTTLSGVAPPCSEPTVPLKLVVLQLRKRRAPRPAPAPSRSTRVPARRRRRWPALLLLVAAAAIGVLALRDRIPWARVRSVVVAE